MESNSPRIIQKNHMNLIIYFCILLSFSNSLLAKDSQRLPKIHRPEKDSAWLPLTYLANGTFDVIQNPYWFSQRNYGNKVGVFWDRVKDPHHNIKKDGGYRKLIEDEFFSSRVLPNIGLHAIGGAYDTLWLRQYFEYYNVPAAGFFSFLFTYGAHVGNEALETTSDEITSHDHIADIYIFDVAAFLMSYSPTIMNYLVKDLDMKAWHFNPVYDLNHDDFFNAGLNYIFRPKALSFGNNKFRPLYFLGMQTMLGLSYDYSRENTLTTAAGMSLTNPLKQKGRFVGAFFHEYQGELEASLFLNGSEDFRYRLNLYDTFFYRFMNANQSKSYQVGLVLGEKKGSDYAFGININLPIGIGAISN